MFLFKVLFCSCFFRVVHGYSILLGGSDGLSHTQVTPQLVLPFEEKAVHSIRGCGGKDMHARLTGMGSSHSHRESSRGSAQHHAPTNL